MDKKIAYLNEYLDSKNPNYYNGPKSLFKYRPFDNYSMDMLENDYIYLCPAEKLDDETECITSLDLHNLYELETDNLKRQCVDLIIDMLKPYSSHNNFEMVKSKIYSIMKPNRKVYPNFMLDLSIEMQKMMPNVDLAPFVNWIVNIPERLDAPEIKPQLEKLITIGLDARKAIGVCSLSESNSIDYMWKNYAADGTGYCVEYDMSNYNESQVFPVVYNDERQTNIVIQLVGNFIGQLIQEMSNGQIKADKSQYLSLFLSKYKKWEYQREWRVLGDAGAKIKAPIIKAIYLGENTNDDNKRKIEKYCLEKSIKLVILSGD